MSRSWPFRGEACSHRVGKFPASFSPTHSRRGGSPQVEYLPGLLGAPREGLNQKGRWESSAYSFVCGDQGSTSCSSFIHHSRAGLQMAAMFLRCGSHPLSGAEIPPTLGPSPASRKPSSTSHCTKCLLWRPPGAPRDSQPATVRNSSVDNPGVSSSLYLPTPTPGLGPPIHQQGGSLRGLLPEQAGAACTQLHSSRHSWRSSLGAVPACCWCRGTRGQGHEPCVEV